MNKRSFLIFGLLCLMLTACAERVPVPFPDSQTIALAHYGEYPENYEYLVALNHTLPSNSSFDPNYIFRDEPRKMMLELRGRYEFGWGGLVDVWYWVGNKDDDYMEKKLFEYMIRDGRLVVFRAQGL